MKNIHETIASRRSIFATAYNGELIEREVIEQLLKNADWAPNHKNTQPWRFLVFHGETLHQLVDKMVQLYTHSTLADEINAVKIEKMQAQKQSVSHIIGIVCEFSNLVPEVEEICAVSCAVQNIYLSLESLNIAGYWSTGGGTFTKEMHDYLELKENQKLLGFFYLGIMNADAKKPVSRRKPLEEKVKWM